MMLLSHVTATKRARPILISTLTEQPYTIVLPKAFFYLLANCIIFVFVMLRVIFIFNISISFVVCVYSLMALAMDENLLDR